MASAKEGHAAVIRRSSTADNSRQQQQIPALERLLDLERRHAQTIIDLRKAQGVAAVIELVQTGLGGRIDRQLETVVGQMQNEELRLLASRNAHTERNLTRTKAVLVLGILVSLLIAVTPQAGASIVETTPCAGSQRPLC